MVTWAQANTWDITALHTSLYDENR